MDGEQRLQRASFRETPVIEERATQDVSNDCGSDSPGRSLSFLENQSRSSWSEVSTGAEARQEEEEEQETSTEFTERTQSSLETD